MRLVELHFGCESYSLNVDYIACVWNTVGGCKVYMLGDASEEPWQCDEPYEEVLRLIKEATNG